MRYSPILPASRLIICTLLLASVLPIMQAGLVAPALSAIRDAFSGSANATLLVRIALVAPTVAVVVSAPLIGALADRMPRAPLLVVGLIAYAVGGIAAFRAGSLDQLIMVRLGLGISIAIVATLTTAFVATLFSSADRARIFGWQAALIGLCSAIFPVCGGLLADYGWSYVFLPYVLSLFLVPLVLVFPRTASVKEAAPSVAASRAAIPIYCLSFSGALILYLLPTQMAFHMRGLGSVSAVTAGFAIGGAGIVAACASMLYGYARARLSFVRISVTAFLLMAVGYGIVGAAPNYLMLAIGLALAGSGFGLHLPNCNAWLASRVAMESRGKAAGNLTTAMFLGQLASPLIYDRLVSAFGSSNTFLIAAAFGMAVAVSLVSRAAGEPFFAEAKVPKPAVP